MLVSACFLLIWKYNLFLKFNILYISFRNYCKVCYKLCPSYLLFLFSLSYYANIYSILLGESMIFHFNLASLAQDEYWVTFSHVSLLNNVKVIWLFSVESYYKQEKKDTTETEARQNICEMKVTFRSITNNSCLPLHKIYAPFQ